MRTYICILTEETLSGDVALSVSQELVCSGTLRHQEWSDHGNEDGDLVVQAVRQWLEFCARN
jgi:hypothetical protein